MKKNKFFIIILLSAILFSGTSFGMQYQQSLPGQQMGGESAIDFMKDMLVVANKIVDVTAKVILTGVAVGIGAYVLLQTGRKTADIFRSKVGPYLPTSLSYFKQIESELPLIKPEKERNGLMYSVDDCFADIAKIITMYNNEGSIYTGKLIKKYHRDIDVKKQLLAALVQKYESFLPKNINKDDWIRYLKDNNIHGEQFQQLSKKYKNDQGLEEAGELIFAENATSVDWERYIHRGNLTKKERQALWQRHEGNQALLKVLDELEAWDKQKAEELILWKNGTKDDWIGYFRNYYSNRTPSTLRSLFLNDKIKNQALLEALDELEVLYKIESQRRLQLLRQKKLQ